MRNRIIALVRWTIERWPLLLLAFGAILGLGIYLDYIRTTVGFRQWSGFENKTLWDVLGLLIVPSVLAGAALLFNQQQNLRGDAVENDRQQENALQNYLDKMTELLLEKGLRTSEADSEVKAVAQAKTITVLRRLDQSRRKSLLAFLRQSKLVRIGDANGLLVEADLRDADLSEVNLSGVNLSGAFLHKANLSLADLSEANLSGAFLVEANLRGTDLHKANLRGADLSDADLREANLHSADLREANLHSANLRKADLSADLSFADISEADLSFADLSFADLRGAKLRKADLTGVKLTVANLREADLTGAKVTNKQVLEHPHTGATMPDGTKHE